MKKAFLTPPVRCVVIDNGTRSDLPLGIEKLFSQQEIHALGSLSKVARVSKIDRRHARELVGEMTRIFS